MFHSTMNTRDHERLQRHHRHQLSTFNGNQAALGNIQFVQRIIAKMLKYFQTNFHYIQVMHVTI